jgi:hypothetical protein
MGSAFLSGRVQKIAGQTTKERRSSL